MLTILLAAIDASSDERFKLLYVFVLFMDWHILDNVDWKSVFKRNKGD